MQVAMREAFPLRRVLMPLNISAHFLRTKIAPLTLDPTRIEDDSYLHERVSAYRTAYETYYNRCATPADPPTP